MTGSQFDPITKPYMLRYQERIASEQRSAIKKAQAPKAKPRKKVKKAKR